MKRSLDRILTTHVGSIPRPAELLEQKKAAHGDLDAYDAQLRQDVAEVVKHQATVGIDIVNDGEFGKESWAAYIIERLTGFEVRPDQRRKNEWLGRDLERFPEYLAETYPSVLQGNPTQACVGEIKYVGQDRIGHAIGALTAALKGVKVEEAFMTAVAPASTAYDGVDEFYGNEHDYVFAIATALRDEYRAIHNAGLLLQVDDAVLANMYDTLVQKSPERYREWAQLRVDALNHALEGIPEDRVRYHVCFGSWHVPHTADAPLENIASLITQVKAGAYAIEAANPRHEHEWRVWEKVKMPNDRILIPGVITHHIVTVEHPQVVADRIVRFAKVLGRENVIAGTDCGFAQNEGIRRAHPKIMWAKFESLAEGAAIATKELWGR